MRRLMLVVALAVALAAPGMAPGAPTQAVQAQVNDPARALHALFEADWQRSLAERPLMATYLGDPRYNAAMPDISSAAVAKQQQATRASLTALLAIPRDALSPADQLNHDIYRRQLETDIAGFGYPTHLMPVDQRGGPHLLAVQMAPALRFETAKHYADWIARLRAYGGFVDQSIALMREGIAAGWVPPKAVMQRVPAQIAAQRAATVEESSFFAPFLSMADSIPAAEQARLRAQAKVAVGEVVLPAIARFETFFNQTYLPATPASVATGDLPNGKAYYDYLARSYTTTDLTADQIHQIGLGEVARIRGEMEKIKTEVGFDGDLAAFFTHLRTDPRFFHATPEALLADYRAMSRRIDPELVRVFGRLPRTPYGIIPIPAAIAPDTTTAYYQRPSADGLRAGYYYVNLYKPESRPRWEMLALSLHEAMPGHHLQISLAQEMPDQPMFRKQGGFTAFIEGWGLYAERLGYDMGLYDDPYDRMGQQAYDMWRAVRLVVDTGLHSKGWSRQQAIDYFAANAPKAELDIANEIDRYISTPGQALAYKIGQLKLSELRARAQTRLGDRFDVRAFHDALLSDGALPLSVLEQRMDAWMVAEAAKTP
ncbi:MAG: DUF885 domain-containing protein [Arenimonas sp.]|uniref:DUF885 domain-containing protein n=1 Tax=Arenimonas sp. TaxID=1872635 RepID=UPI0025B92047|nr:DUF885 domain-containing protein [Arenimonas sp.]MBW8366781.1 DUF885 domain-containing protein [Arenimonas sp.]